MPESGRADPNAALQIVGLNPAFLRSRGIVPLNQQGSQLTVGCVGKLNGEDRAALEFATGLDIQIAELSIQELEAYLAALSALPQRPDPTATPFLAAAVSHTAHAPAAPDRTQQPSLMELLGARLHGFSRSYTPFTPLAQLLEAGYSPNEAGEALIGTSRLTPAALDPALEALAERLAAGTKFDEAVKQDIRSPRWLRLVLAASYGEANQVAAFVRLIKFDRTMVIRSVKTGWKRLECSMLWLATVLIWFVIAKWTGIFVAALALSGAMWFRDLSASHHRTDAMRARVLAMVAVAASLNLPPSAAIRASMASLNAASPTWGLLPDTREGLADALALPPFSRALLIKGSLGEAAGHAANEHSVRSDVKLARCYWLNSRVAVCLFMAALILLGAQ